jgi:hypothetical protein
MCHSARHRTRRGIDWIGYEVRRREDPDIRASDADRERVAQTLRDSAADGRIDTDELDERLETVYAAKTFGELNEVTRDLPVVASRPERESNQHGHSRGAHVPTLVWISLLLVAIWAMTGFGYFWPMWPMLWFGFALLKSRRRRAATYI